MSEEPVPYNVLHGVLVRLNTVIDELKERITALEEKVGPGPCEYTVRREINLPRRNRDE